MLSDVHLGTYGCHAKETLSYLKSIDPEILILNGDIIDIWQFSKRYWPKSHMKVVNKILKMVSNGVKVYYITGNHDELLRKFTDFEIGNLSLTNKVILEIDNKRMWFFHGDIFDISMKHSKWLARLGGKGYDILILLNKAINYLMKVTGREKVSFSKKIKNSVKQAIKFIDDFEKTAVDLAIFEGYDYVICGHIHQPQIKEFKTDKGNVWYLNSGDWIENLTALEYNNGNWNLYKHIEADLGEEDEDSENEIPEAFALMAKSILKT